MYSVGNVPIYIYIYIYMYICLRREGKGQASRQAGRQAGREAGRQGKEEDRGGEIEIIIIIIIIKRGKDIMEQRYCEVRGGEVIDTEDISVTYLPT